MNQEWLMKSVLKDQHTVPDSPNNGRDYLSLEEAFVIVDETIDYLGQHGDETEYTYISGHRKRLAHSLSMIPKAQGKDESCLDVGCYGYMLLWAKKYLGYDRVVGIEWHPDNQDAIIHRRLELNDYSLDFDSHNFDISTSQWSVDEEFDTALFFEVLEHINHDPMGVMERIHHRLKLNGTLVMSVPNAISYKTLREFLVGMPPWTYWFYEPDLSHEPRHCFEYTPLVFKSLIRATGLAEHAFRTIYAYTEPANEAQTIKIAQAIGFSEQELGETMIINSTKVSEQVELRYPDVIYSPKGYYEHIYPQLQSRLRDAHTQFDSLVEQANVTPKAEPQDKLLVACELQFQKIEKMRSLHEEVLLDKDSVQIKLDQAYVLKDDLQQQMQSDLDRRESDLQVAHARNTELQKQVTDLESNVNQMLFNCDCYLQSEDVHKQRVEEADQSRQAAMIEAKDSREWAETLAKENADMNGRINELLFACDCYLQQVNDPARCVQVIREKRFRSVLRTSKAVARKTPILRSALRPMYRSTKKFIKRRM